MSSTSKPKQYELVLWEDPASNFEGWTAITKIDSADVDHVFSVGWPVREDDHFLWLAMDWHDDEANTLGKIPKTAILSRKKINLRGFPPKVRPEVFSESHTDTNP